MVNTYYARNKERVLQRQKERYANMSTEQWEEYLAYQRAYWRARHPTPPKRESATSQAPKSKGIKENTSDVIPSFL